MSLLPREELRLLRWELLGTTPKNRREEWQLARIIQRVNAELAVRAKKIVKK
jgi:hypothetical protein